MPPKDDLTPSESALLVLLLSEARDVSNKELDERFGLSLTGRSRLKLNRLGYVESWKDGRGFAHRLGERGWARCQSPLNFDNVRPRAFGAALGSLLAAVHRDIERTNRSLAMVFAPDLAGTASAPTAQVESTIDIARRIREAYQAVAARPGAWVSLADIRRKLADVPPAELDAALRGLEREPDVNIVPQSNQKALDPDDERAAVTIGDQRKHFLAIGV
jgi:hypothetical protein